MGVRARPERGRINAEKMNLSLACVIVKAREVLRLFGATAGYTMRKSVFAYVFLRL